MPDTSRPTFVEDLSSDKCLACGQPAAVHIQWEGQFFCVAPVMESEATIEAIADRVVEKMMAAQREFYQRAAGNFPAPDGRWYVVEMAEDGQRVFVRASTMSIGKTGTALFWEGDKDSPDSFVAGFSAEHWRTVQIWRLDSVPETEYTITKDQPRELRQH